VSPETLVIDRYLPGIGRFKKATGTTRPKVREKMNEMLDELYETGELQILRDIRDGHLLLMVVFDHWKRGRLADLPSGKTAAKVADAMAAWVAKIHGEYSPEHERSIGTTIMYLTKANPDLTVAEIPERLETLRDSLGRLHPRSFNITRAVCLAFVRSTLKKSHPLWLAISAVEPRKVPKAAARPDLTPDWFRHTFPNPATDAQDACAWAMALSGMGPKEYWGKWEILADRIRIYGTKRESRLRDVPLVGPFAFYGPIGAARLTRDAFRQRLERRTNKRVSPYDFRRTFARWMESAGVTRARRVAYMGHAAGDVTSLYERSEIDAYLVADARKLQAWLGMEPLLPQGLKVAK
jgi:integrase